LFGAETEQIKSSKYIFALKDTEHGCGPNMKVERDLEFELSEVDPDVPK